MSTNLGSSGIPQGLLPGAVTTTRERAEQRRQEKLEFARQQVQNGSLVIRPMAEEERRRYPPLPASPNRLRKR